MKLETGKTYHTVSGKPCKVASTNERYAVGFVEDAPAIWDIISGKSLYISEHSILFPTTEVTVSALVFSDGTYIAFEDVEEANIVKARREREGYWVRLFSHTFKES